MKILNPLLLLSALLAGCVDGNDLTPPPGAPVPHVEADLQAHVLNITMPEGWPVAMVELTITKDMWIRPWVGWFGAGAPFTPIRDPTFWILCPNLQTLGLPANAHALVAAFWLDGGHLTAAAPTWLFSGFGEGDGPRCLTDRESPLFAGGIRSDSPLAGTLVVLVAARPDAPSSPEAPAAPLPAFHLRLGMGRACSDDAASPQATAICLPGEEQPVEPRLRAKAPVWSAYDNFAGQTACNGCGFQVNDTSTHAGAMMAGQVTFARRGAVANGITWVLGGSGLKATGTIATLQGPPGSAGFEAALSADGHAVRASCAADPAGNHWFALMAEHRSPPSFTARFDVAGARNFAVFMLEIPLDLAAAGWHLNAISEAEGLATVYGPSSAGTCGT